MSRQRTIIALPPWITAGIDKIARPGHRTEFIVELLEREIRRRDQLAALDAAVGAWKDENHPELANGPDAWIQQMRQESEMRFQELEKEREAK